MYSIIVESHFDAAHHLVGYKGPCARVHGHRWVVRACWKGVRLNELGMLVDFCVVKAALRVILEDWDHFDLNDSVDQPTAENLALLIYNILKHNGLKGDATLAWVEVEESPGCVIRYEVEEA